MYDPLIVIVEDDATIAELIEFNLQNDGYQTRRFPDGPSMFAVLPQLVPVSLILLDVMLPGPDGFEICKTLKSHPDLELIPVIMLTARNAERDKVNGLLIGADDYIAKPFSVRELLARVEALLRRYGKINARDHERIHEKPASITAKPDAPDPRQNAVIRFGPLRVDDARHRVFVEDTEVDMTNKEYELLKYLMLHPGIAFSRDELLNVVWGYEFSADTRTVDVHIRQIRRKIEADDANPVWIETVRGRGYRFTDRKSQTVEGAT